MTFQIPRESLESQRKTLAAQGIELPPGDTGMLDKFGLKLEYEYQNGILTVRVLKCGLFSRETIEAKLKECFKA